MSESSFRVLFLGTGVFAIPVLEGLLQADYTEVVGVVTQPDKPAGRGRKLTSGPLKTYLDSEEFKNLGLDYPQVWQPAKLGNEARTILDDAHPDIVIVAAYGQMIPEELLNEPKYGALNLHGSILPDLRGAVPVHMAILNGYTETGVTIQKMAKALDAGDILATTTTDIYSVDTTGSLMFRLAEMGRDLLLEILPSWVSGDLELIAQDDSQATYCYQSDIVKGKAQILFDTPVDQAERMIRAYNPDPVAWIELEVNGQLKRVRIFDAVILKEDLGVHSDTLEIKKVGKDLYLVLAEGTLRLEELQLEGKDRRFAEEYLFLG